MADQTARYKLYHHPGSIYSIMVRYTFAIRGEPKNSDAEIILEEIQRSIRDGELLTEDFLCNVNPQGEVPVLVPTDGVGEPIPDSAAITYAFAEKYPSLVPKECEGEVKRLIEKLHEISVYSLTFAGKPQMQEKHMAILEAALQGEISERYRRAAAHKLQMIRTTKPRALEPEVTQQNAERAETYLAEIARFLERSKTGWILDTQEPTALDAHVVVFVCRLQDIHRESLILDVVKRYAEVAMALPAWEKTMEGRRTM